MNVISVPLRSYPKNDWMAIFKASLPNSEYIELTDNIDAGSADNLYRPLQPSLGGSEYFARAGRCG